MRATDIEPDPADLALIVPYWQQLADKDYEAREEYEREQIETAASEAWWQQEMK